MSGNDSVAERIELESTAAWNSCSGSSPSQPMRRLTTRMGIAFATSVMKSTRGEPIAASLDGSSTALMLTLMRAFSSIDAVQIAAGERGDGWSS